MIPRTAVAFLLAILLASAAYGAELLTLDEALRSHPVQGGLCVVVGSADAAFASRLASGKPLLVECLSPDGQKVAAARESLLENRQYGQITVESWEGPTLPYADNLAAMLIAVEPGAATEAEMLRVVRPGGQLLVKRGEQYAITTKPRPAGMDDWTHWRHAADRNPVSQDTLAGVPERVQYLFGHAIGERSHFVCANGRIFAQDGGQIVARDGFSGLPLWTAKIKVGKEVDWEYSVKVSALIVAVGDRVYCVADDGKFKALDAATGKPAVVYEQGGTPHEIAVVEDAAKRTIVVGAAKDGVRALDAATGKLLWKRDAQWPGNLMATDSAVFYIEGNDRRGATEGSISGLELATGKPLWKKTYDWARRTEQGAIGNGRIAYEMRSPTNWREYYEQHKDEKEKDKFNIVVINAATGEEIQKVFKTGSSARHGEFRVAFWYKEFLLTEAQLREGLSLVLFKPDDFSKPAISFKANYVGDRGWGHCYPPVLVNHYYLNGQLNFTDIETQKQSSNQITRGACNTARSGYIPANGMIYTLPKHCLCFPMLDGNIALAPPPAEKPADTTQLLQGPAWPAAPQGGDEAKDWPTFRHDAFRTGGTESALPEKLAALWTAEIPGPDYKQPLPNEWTDNPYAAGPITAPVVAGGNVYVAQSDTHRLFAIDLQTGKTRWTFVADGRIDGPPTIHQGMCLFGSRSGWVYNVRASDGQLIWKLRVAPSEKRISVYGQVESPWPVPGSVLVSGGLGYVAAGIHPNADGGARVVCFEPATGKVVWTNKFADLGFADPWPEPYDPRVKSPQSDPWRTIRPQAYRFFDLPVQDGQSVAISRCLFDPKTGKANLNKISGFYSAGGAWLPRTAWRYGTTRNDSPLAVSLGSAVFSSAPTMGKLFRHDFDPAQPFKSDWVSVTHEEETAGLVHASTRLMAGAKWEVASTETKAAFNRAMLVAKDRLIIAGPKGSLHIYSAADGAKQAEIKLPQLTWDGLAAAQNRLLASTADGKLMCFGEK